MRFTKTHEWIKVCEDGSALVGITEHAQRELGEVVYIELPHLDKGVEIGGEVCVLESTKAAADIYSPVSGTILAVNSQLTQSPSHINKAPMSEGWLYKIQLSKVEEIDLLLTEEEYLALCNGFISEKT